MIPKLLTVSLAALTAAAVFALPQPTVWYRVDGGLATENGKVVKWANEGTLGSELDLTPAVADGADVTLASNVFGKMPAVKFPGSNYLGTASGKETNLGIAQAGNTIFLVALSTAMNATAGGSRFGFYGLKDKTGNNATRFCAFYAANGVNTVLRTHDYAAASGTRLSTVDSTVNAVGQGVVFMSRTLYLANSDRKVSLFLSGKMDKAAVAGPSAYAPWASELRLGHHGLSWNPGEYYDGYIAEFRVYNTGLTAAERYQIEGELAAKYALELKTDADTAIGGRTLANCWTDAVVLGTQPNGGTSATAASEGTSGNLKVTFGAVPASNANSLLYVAHDGGTDESCIYGLAGAAAARAVPLTLTFAESYGKTRLFYRADADQVWRALAVEPLVANSAVSFTLAAGWENGQYALAQPMPKPAVWFRADCGVTTNANGKVTGWDNIGSLGDRLNLTNSLGQASNITLSELNGLPALRIDHNVGQDFLVNGDSTDLGVNLSGGCSYFGVFTAEDINMVSPFGMDFGGSPRFGFQTAKGWNPRYWYGHMFTATTAYGVLDYTAGQQLLGASGWPVDGNPSTWNAVASSGGDTMSCWKFAETMQPDLSKKGRMLVGGFIQSWGKQMFGNIAELRIYDRALTAQEYAAAEYELAATYGLPCAGASGQSVAGCLCDRYVFGRDKRRGTNPAVTITSGTCGALTLAFGAAPNADADSIVRVGRAGGESTADRWCIAAGAGARALPLTLTFSGEHFAAAGRTLWRLEDSGLWRGVSAGRTDSQTGVVYSLPAGWKSGRYAVATEDELTASSAAVWFRADRGVTVNGGGKVVGWANQGTLGNAIDLENVNFASPGVTVADGAFASSPALRFDGNDHLHTAAAVDLGVTASGGAWFIAAKPGNSPNMSLFGLSSAERFGVFRLNGEPKLSATFFHTLGQIFVPATEDNQVLGFSMWEGRGALVKDGSLAGNASWTGSIGGGVFSVGLQSGEISWMTKLKGDIAEVRVYDHPLSAQECAGIELELAARYGLPCAGAPGASVLGCGKDRVVFGRDKNRGTNPAVTDTNATCGALSVALVGMPGADKDSLVRIGRLGEEDLTDEWCIAAGSGARELPLTLTFSGAVFSKADNRLRHKGANGRWTTLAVAPVATSEGVSYLLPASWNSGRYRIESRHGLMILVR